MPSMPAPSARRDSARYSRRIRCSASARAQGRAGRASRTTVSPTRRMRPKTSDLRSCAFQVRPLLPANGDTDPIYCHSPRRPATIFCRPVALASSPGTGAVTTTSMRDQKRRGGLRHRRLATLPAEEAAIQPAQRHGHHGHGPALEDLLHAFLELVELAVLRELALGKDADDFAVGELGVDAVERLLQRRRDPRAPARSEWRARCGR